MTGLVFPDGTAPTPLFRPGDPVVVVDAIDESGVPFLGGHGNVVDFAHAQDVFDDYNVTVHFSDGDKGDFSEVELTIDEARLFAQDHSNTA